MAHAIAFWLAAFVAVAPVHSQELAELDGVLLEYARCTGYACRGVEEQLEALRPQIEAGELRSKLRHADPEIRVGAMYAMSLLDQADDLEREIAPLLGDDDRNVRAVAREALLYTAPDAMVRWLDDAVTASSVGARTGAFEALAALIEEVELSTEDDGERTRIVRSVERGLADDSAEVQIAAANVVAEVVWSLDDEEKRPLLNRLLSRTSARTDSRARVRIVGLADEIEEDEDAGEWLLPLLEHADSAVRLEAWVQLADRGLVPPGRTLVDALVDGVAQTKAGAARLVEELDYDFDPDPSFFDELDAALIALLAEPDTATQVAAFDALGFVADDLSPERVDELFAGLRALLCGENVGPADSEAAYSLQTLILSLGDVELGPSAAGVEELAERVMRECPPPGRRILADVLPVLREAKASEIAALGISDAATEVRAAFASVLADLPEPSALRLAELAVADAEPATRAALAGALAKIATPEASALLRRLLADSDDAVLLAAATAYETGFEGKEDPEAVAGLVALLTHRREEMRSTAAAALGVLGDPRAAPDLERALTGDESLSVQERAARALMRLGGEHPSRALGIVLANRPEYVPQLLYDFAEAAEKSPSLVGADVVRAVTPLLANDAARFGALLVVLANPDALDRGTLLELAHSEDRYWVAGALAKITDDALRDELAHLLIDENPDVRLSATFSLEDLPDDDAARLLERALVSAQTQEQRESLAYELARRDPARLVPLAASDPRLYLAGLQTLDMPWPSEAIDALIGWLAPNGDPELRREAARLLAADGRAAAALRALALDDDPELRRHAARAIIATERKREAADLLDGLAERPWRRYEVTSTINQLELLYSEEPPPVGDTRGVAAAIAALLDDSDAAVRRTAVAAALSSLGMAALPDLRDGFTDADALVRFASCAPFTDLPRYEPMALTASEVAAFASDPDERVRICAARAAGAATDDEEIAESLAELLTDDASDVRATAAEIVGKSARPTWVGALLPLLDDPAVAPQDAAFVALGTLRSAEAVPRLAEIVCRTRDGDIGEDAAAALTSIGTPAALDAVANAVARQCVGALSFYSDPPLDAATAAWLVEALEHDSDLVREWAAESLLLFDSPVVETALLAHVDDSSESMRALVVDLLDSSSSARAGEALAAALDDPSQLVRGAAIESIREGGNSVGVDALVARLAETAQGDERQAIIDALAGSGNDRAAEALLALAEAEDERERSAARHGLYLLDWDAASPLGLDIAIESADLSLMFSSSLPPAAAQELWRRLRVGDVGSELELLGKLDEPLRAEDVAALFDTTPTDRWQGLLPLLRWLDAAHGRTVIERVVASDSAPLLIALLAELPNLSLGNGEIESVMQRILRSEDGRVKIAALAAIGDAGSKGSHADVRQLLSDADDRVAAAAAETLLELDAATALADVPAERLLNWPDAFRAWAEAVEQTDSQSRFAALLEQATGERQDIADPACQALAADSARTLPDACWRRAELLLERPTYRARFFLEPLSSRDRPRVVALVRARIAAGALGEDEAEAIVDVVNDLELDVPPDELAGCCGHRNALAFVRPPAATPAPASLLSMLASEPDSLVRDDAATTLGDYLEDPAAVAALETALADPSLEVRLEAATALARAGNELGRRHLVELLADGRAEVRGDALEAAAEAGVAGDLRAVELAPFMSGARRWRIADAGRLAPSTDPAVRSWVAQAPYADVGELNHRVWLTRTIDRSPDLRLATPSLSAEQVAALPSVTQRVFAAYLQALRSEESEDWAAVVAWVDFALETLEGIDWPELEAPLAMLAVAAELELANAEPPQSTARTGHLARAREASAAALAHAEPIRWHRVRNWERYFEVEATYWLGRTQAAAGETEQAVATWTRSLQRLEELRAEARARDPSAQSETGEPSWVDREHDLLLLKLSNHRSRALQVWSDADAALAARAATGVEQRTREVVGERIQAYLSAARAAIDAERYEEAERNLEQATLLQHSASVPIGEIALADSTRGAALARWQTLERERAELRLRLEQLPSADPATRETDAAAAEADTGPAPGGEAERRRALTAALREKTADLQRYWTQLKEDHPDLAALVRGEPIEMRRVQSLLPADVLLLRYMILDDELVTVVVGSDALDAIRTPLAGADLRADVLAYHEQYLAFAWENADGNVASQTAVVNAVRGFEPAQRAAGYDTKRLADLSSSLYERLLAPVEEAGYLEGKRFLGISPNAALNYVPFAALAKRDGAALGERLPVFYFGGTSLLWGALDRAAQAPWSELGLVALGNPDGTLPGAETEVSEIGKLFGPRAQVLPREQATASALQAQADRPRVVHLAAHGVLDAEDPRASYIALADGPLTIDQVWRLPFEGVALTTLSACQTGVGPVLTGDEIVSLESAFVFAGSASVVASLWPVETRSTEFLMQRFYTHMANGAAKADALAAAQRDTRAEAAWAHPYYWSGFVLRGSWQ